MPNQSMVGGVLLVVTHSGDETYGDVKTPGNNVRGRIVRSETCGEVTHGVGTHRPCTIATRRSLFDIYNRRRKISHTVSLTT
jgi:hypothetical protein